MGGGDMNVIAVLVLLATAAPVFAQGSHNWRITDSESAVVGQLEGGLFSARVERGKFLVVWARVAPGSGTTQSVAASDIEISGYTGGRVGKIISEHPAVGIGIGTRAEAIGSSRSRCGYLIFEGFIKGGASFADKDPAVGSFHFDRADANAPVRITLKGPASLCLAFAVPEIAAGPDRLTLRFGDSKSEVKLGHTAKEP
jgi:hypothetical protein